MLGANYFGGPYFADFYVGVSGSVALSRSNTVALDGSWSLKITNGGTEQTIVVEVGPYPVTAGDVYSWTAAFLDGGSHESAYASVAWYDSATFISNSEGSTITTSGTEWEASLGTATAPAGATLAFVTFTIDNAPGSSVFYVDGGGLFPGPAAVWSYPSVGVATLRTLTYVGDDLVSVA